MIKIEINTGRYETDTDELELLGAFLATLAKRRTEKAEKEKKDISVDESIPCDSKEETLSAVFTHKNMMPPGMRESTEETVFSEETIEKYNAFCENAREIHENGVPESMTTLALSPNAYASITIIDLDSAGIPWDERIHSRTKSKTKDGKWKVKRNVDPEQSQVILGQLAEVAAIPSPILPPPPPLDVNPTVDRFIPPPPKKSGGRYIEFMQWLTPLMAGGGISLAEVLSILKMNGVDNIPLLASRPDLIEGVETLIEEYMEKNIPEYIESQEFDEDKL